jgi:hypothetical protein
LLFAILVKHWGIEEVAATEDGIYISNKTKQIKVTSTSKLIDKVQIYDLAGKLIYSKSKLIQTKQLYLT